MAKGDWRGETSEDSDTETVEAVDVRIVKSVATDRDGDGNPDWNTSTFTQDAMADYRLSLATSEYVQRCRG